MSDITVCLLSGGMDSCVAATLSKQQGDELYLLSIKWGQTLVRELEHARKIAKILQPCEHKFLDLCGYDQLSRSALTADKKIPDYGNLEKDASRIPVSYPPGRDPSFIMIASSWLESIMLRDLAQGKEINSGKVVIGTNKEDSLVYPDCDPKVYVLLNRLFEISTKVGRELNIPFEVKTPLIGLTKKNVIKMGHSIGAPIEQSWSCYKGEEKRCGGCNPCRIIYFAFRDLKIDDPFDYQKLPRKRYS